jgi:hypothetical protein
MADPAQFTTLALSLERAGTAGVARSTARSRCVAQAGSSGLLVQQGWRSPAGAGVATALAEWRRVGHAPDRVVTDAYKAMGHLAIVARRTAAALAEADQHERNILGTVIDRFDDARSRLGLNVLDFVGLVGDDDAQRQRDEMDRANRAREQAAADREAALRTWHEALEAAARFITRATDELRRNTIPVPAALAPVPTAPPPMTPPPAVQKPEDLIPPMPPRVVAVDPTPNDWNTMPKAPVLHYHGLVQSLIAGAEVGGLNNAARHMSHYLDNTGTALDIDPDRVAREVPTVRFEMERQARLAANHVARQAIAEGRLGEAVPFSSDWEDGEVDDRHSQDWYYAMGSYHIAATGIVIVESLDPPKATVHYRTHLIDHYNWDEGKAVEIFGHTIKDEQIGALHKAGLAREFDTQGTSVVHTMTLGPEGGLVSGGTAPDGREHPGSRGDPGRVVPPDISRSGP